MSKETITCGVWGLTAMTWLTHWFFFSLHFTHKQSFIWSWSGRIIQMFLSQGKKWFIFYNHSFSRNLIQVFPRLNLPFSMSLFHVTSKVPIILIIWMTLRFWSENFNVIMLSVPKFIFPSKSELVSIINSATFTAKCLPYNELPGDMKTSSFR